MHFLYHSGCLVSNKIKRALFMEKKSINSSREIFMGRRISQIRGKKSNQTRPRIDDCIPRKKRQGCPVGFIMKIVCQGSLSKPIIWGDCIEPSWMFSSKQVGLRINMNLSVIKRWTKGRGRISDHGRAYCSRKIKYLIVLIRQPKIKWRWNLRFADEIDKHKLPVKYKSRRKTRWKVNPLSRALILLWGLLRRVSDVFGSESQINSFSWLFLVVLNRSIKYSESSRSSLLTVFSATTHFLFVGSRLESGTWTNGEDRGGDSVESQGDRSAGSCAEGDRLIKIRWVLLISRAERGRGKGKAPWPLPPSSALLLLPPTTRNDLPPVYSSSFLWIGSKYCNIVWTVVTSMGNLWTWAPW